MPGFKIVQTTEKGAQKLFIIPSAWEYKGLIRYPKKTADFKLARNENSKPDATWPVMPCKVKRIGFVTYSDADAELKLMMQHSDTDICDTDKTDFNDADKSNKDKIDFNEIANQLMVQSQIDVAPQNFRRHEETFVIINNDTNDMFDTSSQNQPGNDNIMIKKLDTILSNQNEIMEIQKRFAQRVGNLVLEIEAKVEKVMKRVLDSQTVTPLQKANPIENTAFKLKPIDSIEELEEFELLLLDPVEKRKFIQLYSILCASSKGHGITCAYKLIDILFTREFLCQCSWSGGSRGDKVKIALKRYKNVLDFFFQLVFFWDETFSIEANENFFKIVLRNAEQRKKIKNLRKPAMRKRKRKLRNGSDKETTKKIDEKPAGTNAQKEDDEDEILEEEKEENSEKEGEEEEGGGRRNMADYIEIEVDKDLEVGVEEILEEDIETEVEKDLEEWVEEKEEDVENDKENKVEKDIEEEMKEIKKGLEKVSAKGNKEGENRENPCKIFVRAVKRKKVKTQDKRKPLNQSAPKRNQQDMKDKPECSHKLKKKMKAVDNINQSVTPSKKIKLP